MIKKIKTKREYKVGNENYTTWYLFGIPFWKFTCLDITHPLPRLKDGLDAQYGHKFL